MTNNTEYQSLLDYMYKNNLTNDNKINKIFNNKENYFKSLVELIALENKIGDKK
jgi:hypothetical protein